MTLALAVLVLCAVLAVLVHDFFEGETLVADILDEWRLSRRTLAELDAAWAANPNRTSTVISLTSIPSRLPFIAPTVKSLLRQTVAPERIILNIPAYSTREKKPYVVPDFLKGLKAVEIHVCEDLGPATKLLPSLVRLPPDQPILVVDDDRIYHRSVLECLLAAAGPLPGTAVGHSGWLVPPDLTDRPTTVRSNLRMLSPAPIRARRLSRPVEVDILQGLSGYLIRPDQFDLLRLSDYRGAPEAARLADDVWIAGHSKVLRYVVPARRTNYQPKLLRRFFRRTSLGLMNRGPGGNANRSNSIVIRHLSAKWMVSKPRPDR
jgi:hypothetical protein